MDFIQELSIFSSGYGYIYRKKVSLVVGKPEMFIEHILKNVGTRAIHTSVDDHNFLVLDKQPIGTGFTITVPFAIHSDEPPKKEFAEIRKNQIVYLKTLTGQDVVATPMEDFGTFLTFQSSYRECERNGGNDDQRGSAMAKMAFWSIRSVLAVEPFVDVSAEPGGQTSWRYVYDYAPPRKRQITGPGYQSQGLAY